MSEIFTLGIESAAVALTPLIVSLVTLTLSIVVAVVSAEPLHEQRKNDITSTNITFIMVLLK